MNIVEEIRERKIKKLTDVGFTREQAEILIEMISTSNFGL
jgi:hypothetical protein